VLGSSIRASLRDDYDVPEMREGVVGPADPLGDGRRVEA